MKARFLVGCVALVALSVPVAAQSSDAEILATVQALRNEVAQERAANAELRAFVYNSLSATNANVLYLTNVVPDEIATLRAIANRALQVNLDIAEVQIKGFNFLGVSGIQLGLVGGVHPSQLRSHGAPVGPGESWLPDILQPTRR
jgi:hypothetical protein